MPDMDPVPIAGLFADLASALARERPGPADADTRDPSALGQQILYERWLKKPAWRLRDEAIPLLLGIDPEEWRRADGATGSTRLVEAHERVWDAVRASVMDRAGLRVVDPDAAPADWCVEPAEIYRFASARGMVVPAPLTALMDFILRTVKPSARGLQDQRGPDRRGRAEPFEPSVRERVLGAALNVLAKCPDECYDEHGLVSGARIALRIAAQSMRWFDVPTPPLSQAELAAFIDRWLE